MATGISHRMLRGAGWMVLFKLVERSLGLVSTLILLRLLAPDDFGLVAMATSFIVMAELLTAFGFDVALIQNRGATERHYHAAWTCNVLLGGTIGALMIALAIPIAEFYHQPALRWVVCLLALGPAIGGLENVGVVAFRKELDFRREFVFQLLKKAIGFLITVPLAFWLRDYRALVFGMLASRLTGTGISYLLHGFRPRFSLQGAGDILHFSKWLLASNVLAFMKERSTDLVLGRLRGAGELGMYSVSYEFANLPTTELSAPINRALLPGFARLAADAAALRAAYTGAMGMLAALAIPAAAGIWSLSDLIVPVVLGRKWLGAVPLMQILALYGSLQMLHSSMCAVLIGAGHPRSVAKGNAWFVFFLLALMAALVPAMGATGAALAILAATVLATPVYLAELRRHAGIPASAFLRATERPLLAAVAMATLLRLLVPAWNPEMSQFHAATLLCGGVVAGMIFYAAALLALWAAMRRPPGVEQMALQRAQALFRSLRGRGAS